MQVFTEETPISLKAILTVLLILGIVNSGFAAFLFVEWSGKRNTADISTVQQEISSMKTTMSGLIVDDAVAKVKIRNINSNVIDIKQKVNKIYDVILTSSPHHAAYLQKESEETVGNVMTPQYPIRMKLLIPSTSFGGRGVRGISGGGAP